MNLQLEADIPSDCGHLMVTMTHDTKDRPYLYVAHKESGVSIYDISAPQTPTLAANVPLTLLDSLQVMSLSQDGDYLYLATGTHFNDTEYSGMAIIDVSDPTNPVVTDLWHHPTGTGGSGIVRVEGDIAYLGAMKNGLVLLDVSNKDSIAFLSEIIPDINWPVNNPNADLYNARGMEVINGIVYLCYDAGGVRVINCTDPKAPVETGRFCNPVMYTPINRPRAYNNIVINNNLAYVTVDYCGVEVWDISDTSAMTLEGWWNPYNCPNNNWFTSPSHANEIHLDAQCNKLFVSTGKSDLIVLDLSSGPTQPDSCTTYGGTGNGIGTWGVSIYNEFAYLSYVCTLGVPFASNWSGVKILRSPWCTTSTPESYPDLMEISVFPQPASRDITVSMPASNATFSLISINGSVVSAGEIDGESESIDVSDLEPGIYFLHLSTGDSDIWKKIGVIR
ncbi:MAG: T9SS type A sorting domain-containing protein [Flavobacteriales bacterium]|nr:T9SS type A sorting domain-containing protein [Flavobacteriales bacterium]